MGKIIVRFLFIEVGQGADVKGPKLGGSRRRAQAHGMLAQAAVGRDFHRGLDLSVIDDLQFGHCDARIIKQDFFRVR